MVEGLQATFQLDCVISKFFSLRHSKDDKKTSHKQKKTFSVLCFTPPPRRTIFISDNYILLLPN